MTHWLAMCLEQLAYMLWGVVVWETTRWFMRRRARR